MESVIDLVSSDEEDEPVICTRQVDIPNSKVLKRVDSKVKVERGGVVAEDDDDHRGSCSTSDQACEFTGVQTERRAKVGALGKGKSAVGSAGITPVADAQEKSLCRHFWQAGDYEAQAPKRRRPLQGVTCIEICLMSQFLYQKRKGAQKRKLLALQLYSLGV